MEPGEDWLGDIDLTGFSGKRQGKPQIRQDYRQNSRHRLQHAIEDRTFEELKNAVRNHTGQWCWIDGRFCPEGICVACQICIANKEAAPSPCKA